MVKFTFLQLFYFLDESNVEKLDSSIPFIPLDELKEATNGWHFSTILGRGGFGVVFKGYWKQTYVAIKKLEPPVCNQAGIFVSFLFNFGRLFFNVL